jgi:hypothetical protein
LFSKKGLGTPVGAILVGSTEFINRFVSISNFMNRFSIDVYFEVIFLELGE